MVVSMNVFKIQNAGKIKKNVKKRKKRALNKNVKNVFYIYDLRRASYRLCFLPL